MPTNANTFNSRITSEALEKKFRDVFPAQGGAELIQDLYAAGTIQPVIDFSTVAEGSVLPQNLQTAIDFSVNTGVANNGTVLIANTPGFWLVRWCFSIGSEGGVDTRVQMFITDGLTNKDLRDLRQRDNVVNPTNTYGFAGEDVVFLRSGDSVSVFSSDNDAWGQFNARQIADVNGNLVNPLGFTFS